MSSQAVFTIFCHQQCSIALRPLLALHCFRNELFEAVLHNLSENQQQFSRSFYRLTGVVVALCFKVCSCLLEVIFVFVWCFLKEIIFMKPWRYLGILHA